MADNVYLIDAGWTREPDDGPGHVYRDPVTGRRFYLGTAMDVQTARDKVAATKPATAESDDK